MIGDYKYLDGQGYLVVNRGGTLQKLPKLPLRWILWFSIKTQFKKISLQEVKSVAQRISLRRNHLMQKYPILRIFFRITP